MRISYYIKVLAQLLLQDYSFYQIYGRHCTGEKASLIEGFRFKQIEKEEIDNCKDGMIAEQAWYHGQDTQLMPALKVPVL